NANSPVPTIMRAEMLIAMDRVEEATNVLQAACQLHPNEIALWIARSALASRLSHHDIAAGLLDEAQERLGDRFEIRQQRIRQSVELEREAAQIRLADLTKGWQRFSADEQFVLNRQTAITYTSLGCLDKAEIYWSAAIGLRPEWLPGYLYLFD